ncbi:hypothetical protein CDA63_02535 [Hymenobacter amundsenii]|uniref:Glycosyltransferase RgtA/B/C/D-like domain-containing protein n=1 Tax=Hymenobacter amundsenii TaxID=2006685 RepID=A0A246FPH8_9BACT|nr:hypothetical protein [Hymenobacter amundsenii]OWP64655.1 hypothetical protein CDA63_02535 [Hymenobacter amundsenii]
MTAIRRAGTTFFWLLLAALVLISAGLYNGFPLVTSDSGTYLNSAINRTVPDDRPLTYGLWVLVTGLRKTLWLVIFAQGLLLAALLWRTMSAFAPRLRHPAGRLALVAGVAWLTGVAWYSSQLMPDIFTAIGLLALALLLLSRPAVAERLALLAVLLLAAIMHSSNLLTLLLTVLAVGAVAWGQHLFRRGIVHRPTWWLTLAVTLAGWLVLPALHAGFGGGFTLSRASSAFLVARLSESGVLEKYLADNCGPDNKYRLCEFRNQLPNDAITFMWDASSPLNQTGGWNANRAEYQRILRGILLSPRYYPVLLSETVQATLRQLTHIGHGDGLTAFRENTNPYWKVGEYASYELKEYMSSMQNRSQLEFQALNERTYGAHLLALLVLGLALLGPGRRRVAPALVGFVLVVGVGIGANALVTGGLANVLDRLQGRVAWLLPWAALLLLAQYLPLPVRWLGSGGPGPSRPE